MKSKELIEIASRIRALAQNGLLYSLSEYDTDRYSELLELSNKITSVISGHSITEISNCFALENDYVTPKVDVRAVVFNDQGEILLVREYADGLWSLPGGWADIGFSPKEVAEKEVAEETGLTVKATRLLAVLDKKHHPHPPALHYTYKIFILCELTGGAFNAVFDILDKGFFAQDNIPPLSECRVLKSQIDLLFEYKKDPSKEALID